jgi:opacity protein-like surface antigen
MIRRSLLMGVLLATIGLRAGAEDTSTSGTADHRSSEFSIQPGIAAFSGDAGDYQDNSFSLDGQWLWGVHDVVKIGPEIGYVFGSEVNGPVPGRFYDQGNSVVVRSDIKARILHMTPQIKIGPVLDVQGWQINPYVIGGGGYYWTHFTDGTASVTGVVAGVPLANDTVPFGSKNDHNGGFNIGLGTSLMLPQNFGLGFEVRYHKILYKAGNDVSWFAPAARLTFYFR